MTRFCFVSGVVICLGRQSGGHIFFELRRAIDWVFKSGRGWRLRCFFWAFIS